MFESSIFSTVVCSILIFQFVVIPEIESSTLSDGNFLLNEEFISLLEAKLVDRIEALYQAKIEQLNIQIEQLKNANDVQIAQLWKTISTTNADGDNKYSLPRSCYEILMADPTVKPDNYYIDPDGASVGEPPVQVYCDMNTGTTKISHNSETQMDVSNCNDPGCYNRSIEYMGVSMKQMTALAAVSNQCRQTVRYDCTVAPFEFNGEQQSWWNDRNGDPRYFWTGANTNNNAHTCQCGVDKTCLDQKLTCDCDAMAIYPLWDEGVLTDKELLPVTKLFFGRIGPNSNGKYTLGKFECSGQLKIPTIPSSCRELQLIGHQLNGLYLINSTDRIDTVYCDFTQPPGDPSFQTLIGRNDIKLASSYFFVQRNSNYGILNSIIPFQIERLNVGKAMNLATGTFTAPSPGRYFFSLSGIANLNMTRVQLQLNDVTIGTAWGEMASNTFSLQSTLSLKKGDRITLVLANGGVSDTASSQQTHFTGMLIEEDFN